MVCGIVSARLLAVAALACCAGAALAAPRSLPGDADCNGLVTESDLVHLAAELADGDGAATGAVDGGAVVSCSGADANGDGAVTAADFSALGRVLGGADAGLGPRITYIGIASADGTTTQPAGDVPVPTYQSVGGLGFRLVIEAAPGASGLPVGQVVFRPGGAAPDLQVEVTRPLGDGNPAVCGEGGVPAIAPPSFDLDRAGVNALNDLGCRVEVASNPFRACTVDAFGAPRFVDARTRVQFCLSVSSVEVFRSGATIVTARVLDVELRLRAGVEPLHELREPRLARDKDDLLLEARHVTSRSAT